MAKSFSILTTLLVTLALSGPIASSAQTPAGPTQSPSATPQTPDPTQSLARLSEAREALSRLPEGTGATARALADLRRDFALLQSMYVAQNSTAGIATAGAGSSTGAVGSGGTPVTRPVGTSGSIASTAATDWRTQYALVTSDIGALRASADEGSGLQMPLQEFQARLEKFFTATLGPAPSPVASATPPSQSPSSATARPPDEPAPAVKPNNSEAIVLLQRMQELLDRQKSDAGKSLKSSGKVTLDRADLDEIAAEIQQLKIMLQK